MANLLRAGTMRIAAGLLALAMSLSGCAYGTMVHGSNQGLLFNSSPSGAQVSINGQEIGKTPLTWQVPRKSSALVEFKKAGCEKKQVMLNNELSGIVFLNLVPFLLLGLVIGTVIDMSSGGAYNLRPDPVYVSLDCGDQKLSQEESISKTKEVR